MRQLEQAVRSLLQKTAQTAARIPPALQPAYRTMPVAPTLNLGIGTPGVQQQQQQQQREEKSPVEMVKRPWNYDPVKNPKALPLDQPKRVNPLSARLKNVETLRRIQRWGTPAVSDAEVQDALQRRARGLSW